MDDELKVEEGWLQRSPLLLRLAIVTLIACVFIADMTQHWSTAIATLYAIPLLVTLWFERRRVTLIVAWTCIVLTIAVTYGHVPNSDDRYAPVIATRATTVFAIGIATMLGLMRLRTERELRYVRNVSLTALRSLGEAVIMTNTDGTVRFVNRVAERLLGRDKDDLLGKQLSQVFLARDVPSKRPPIEELVAAGHADEREAVLFTLGGRRIAIEYSRTAIERAGGERYGTVLVFRDITARKEYEEQMRRLAYRDDLTGLPNRISLLDRLQLEIDHAKRNRTHLGLVYLDLDGFKEVNDGHGHDVGDELLRGVAQRIRSSLRGGDTVARLGGDEFVVLLPDVGGVREARAVGTKILQAIEERTTVAGHEVAVSASLGIALYPRDGVEPETLMRRADKAMYRAKSRGRGGVELATLGE
jgi:diguanylate cyclase (GGDEF)-like protein/PAS domain S-box-containing protein